MRKSRKLSDNIEVPKNYPNFQPNGVISKKTEVLASVQNLPAVLTDPRKGKQNLLFPENSHVLRLKLHRVDHFTV